jgi:isopenicillin-N epimerase
MHMDNFSLNFDPRFEDPEKLKALSRRGFMGRLAGGVAAGAALLSLRSKASAAPRPADDDNIPEADDEGYWQWVTEQFMLQDGLAYMNTGTRGPSPIPVHQAQVEALEGVNTDYTSYSRYVYNGDFRAGTRQKLADFIGCKTSEVAFTNNTTEGMVFGTFGPDLKPGDEIIYTNHDHSSGAQPINLRAKRQGMKAVVVDLSDPKFHPPDSPDVLLKAFEAAITPRTKLISFCHVNYTDGGMLPVKEICAMARAKGIMTLVDGAQPPGMLKLDMHDLGCDMYAGPCHKWMLASMYTGFFYVREDTLDRVWPTVYSGPVDGLTMYGSEPLGAAKAYYDEYLATAARFELRGSSNAPARVAIDAALDFHNMLTPQGIEGRTRFLAAKLMRGLKGINGVNVHVSEDPRLSCALVSFTVNGVPTRQLNAMLWKRHHIYIRNVTHAEINWDVNRASMHIMVSNPQVDTLIGAIEEIAKEKRL